MFWQKYTPDPILFDFGSLSVHWYGLIMVSAIIVASLYVNKYLKSRLNASTRQVEDLVFYLVIFGLIGARFGHVVFFEWEYYSQNLGDIVKIWNGGQSIQGALLFAVITLFFWTKKNKFNFWRVSDILVPAVALGQAIGRWGNYFNQELYGRPTTGWWGIPITEANRIAEYEFEQFYHPTFFYESILNLLAFWGLHTLLQRMRVANPGLVTLLYFVVYSIIRFFMEFVRIDQTFVLAGYRLPQVISLLIFVLASVFIYWMYLRPLPKVKK